MLPTEAREIWISQQDPEVLEEIVRGEWWWVSRPEQVPPPGAWLVRLVLSGRGWGKSRSGSEWLVDRTQEYPTDRHGVPTEHLVVAETLSDARSICMEGPAGILRVLERRKIEYKYRQAPKPMILFPGGSKIYCEGADDEDVGRGYTLASLWGDETVKWKNAYASWYEGILPALRADLAEDHPRAYITTTPKPGKLLREWLADAASDDPSRRDTISVVRGSTFDNKENLSAHMIQALQNRYEGTDIGRQELYGEMLEETSGALFRVTDLNKYRVEQIPADRRVVSIIVGVDPALVDDSGSLVATRRIRSADAHDEMGVCVVARTSDDHLWCLADETIQSAGRDAALYVWRVMLKWNASMVVCEENLGKQWMRQVFYDAFAELVRSDQMPENVTPPMDFVDSRLGKKTRAEPVAMRSQQGKLHMVGLHEKLEDQMTLFNSWESAESPDRLDALVHACRKHMINERKRGRIVDPRDHQSPDRWDDGLGNGFDFRW